jgi:hypothetical protein
MRTKIIGAAVLTLVALKLINDLIGKVVESSYPSLARVLIRCSIEEPISLEALAGIAKKSQLITYLALANLERHKLVICTDKGRWYPTERFTEIFNKNLAQPTA